MSASAPALGRWLIAGRVSVVASFVDRISAGRGRGRTSTTGHDADCGAVLVLCAPTFVLEADELQNEKSVAGRTASSRAESVASARAAWESACSAHMLVLSLR